LTAPVTLPGDYFDAMYQAATDPWGFEDRWYERRKYAISLALLPDDRYRSAFEPGCSIGVLTRLLGRRCDRLLSCDGAEAAVRAAAQRTRDLPQVLVERRQIPRQWPGGRFDLVVFSEILYYLGDGDLDQVLSCGVGALQPGGTLLAVHWRHPVADYPRSGDDVHQALAARPGLARLVSHQEPDFLAEVYIRTDATPVSDAHQFELLVESKARKELPQRVSVMTAPRVEVGCPAGVARGPMKFLLDDIRLPDFDEFCDMVVESHNVSRPVAVHCVTRLQIVLTVAVLEAAGCIPGDRIEHGAVIPFELMSVLQTLGVTVVTNPGFIYERGDTYAIEVDADDQADLYRCGTLRTAGIPVAAGTDSPFGPDDPWAVARTCRSRQTYSGMELGPGERIDAWAALSLFFGSAESPALPRTVSAGGIGDLCIMFTPMKETLRALSADDVAASVIMGEVIADNR